HKCISRELEYFPVAKPSTHFSFSLSTLIPINWTSSYLPYVAITSSIKSVIIRQPAQPLNQKCTTESLPLRSEIPISRPISSKKRKFLTIGRSSWSAIKPDRRSLTEGSLTSSIAMERLEKSDFLYSGRK